MTLVLAVVAKNTRTAAAENNYSFITRDLYGEI